MLYLIDLDNHVQKENFIPHDHLSLGTINNLLHDCEGNLKIYSPRKIIFPSGVAHKKYNFPWGNKSQYFPQNHAINV